MKRFTFAILSPDELLLQICNVNYALAVVMRVVVVYFLFLISTCVLHVVVTSVVYHLHHRSETKPFVAMPICVSSDS